MKSNTKVYVFAISFSILFLAALVGFGCYIGTVTKDTDATICTTKEQKFFNRAFKHGKNDYLLNDITKESCEQFNNILEYDLYPEDIEIRLSSDKYMDRHDENHLSGIEHLRKIIINEKIIDYGKEYFYKDNIEILKGVVNHELVHLYVEKYYPGENTNKNNSNHCGKFTEIENKLRSNGINLARDYIRESISL